jgi:rhodanese-related sulfurtransferase
MRRRSFLTATVLSTSALAGCLGGGSGPATPSDDGASSTPATSDGFERTEVEGEMVPLVPVDVTYEWYAGGTAKFADARGEGQYEEARIEGAVWSPAPDGRADDPVEEWATDERIVCYCGCPHHLSSLRAADLIEKGYEAVYVIDEGFFEWADRGHPVVGTAVEGSARVIRGRTHAAHAGEPVYASHGPTDQREAAFVGENGAYELHLRFADLGPSVEIRVDAPEQTVVAPLSELTDGVLTPP